MNNVQHCLCIMKIILLNSKAINVMFIARNGSIVSLDHLRSYFGLLLQLHQSCSAHSPFLLARSEEEGLATFCGDMRATFRPNLAIWRSTSFIWMKLVCFGCRGLSHSGCPEKTTKENWNRLNFRRNTVLCCCCCSQSSQGSFFQWSTASLVSGEE